MQWGMFEVVGLSKNEILKEKLAEFFDRTSMASSSQNKNISSVRDNYDKNMPKSGISSINKQLIVLLKVMMKMMKGIILQIKKLYKFKLWRKSGIKK